MTEKANEVVEQAEELVVEKTIEATDKKQATWNKLGDNVVVSFPSGKQLYFNYQKLDSMIMKYYGTKQWLSDQVASDKAEADKIANMKLAYEEAVTAGLELTETGKIRIVGKVRSNASGAAEAKRFHSDMKTMSEVVSLEGLVMKKAMSGKTGFPEFTEADQSKLDELMKAAVEIQNKTDKK